MKILRSPLWTLVLLSLLGQLSECRTLLLNTCSVNVHTHELRKYYTDIRANAQAGDSEMGIKLLDKSLMTDVQEGQACCFMHLVLRFYVERVFSNYASAVPQNQRCSSALANSFVRIRRDIHKCHCTCDESTQRTVDALHTEFVKLQVDQAARKAVGELDTVLDWLDGLEEGTM